jgi:hypothetical protein
MKTLFLGLGILMWCATFAHTDTTKCTEHAVIIYADSLKKDEIFTRCMEWVNNTNRDSQMLVQMQDNPRGIILVKAVFKHTAQSSYDVNYTIKIQVKDGRLKFETYNFTNDRTYSGSAVYQGLGPLCIPYRDKQGGTMKSFREQVFNDMVNKAKTEFDTLAASLKTYLKAK